MAVSSNSGPRVTTYERKPKCRSAAQKVWVAAMSAFGAPPSFLTMAPPRRWMELPDGQKVLTTTTMWLIGTPTGDDTLVFEGPAKEVAQEIRRKN